MGNRLRRLNHEEFLARLWNVKSSDEFEVLDKYTLQQVPMRFLHKKCGKEFLATPNNMCKSTYGGCPTCGQIKRTLTKRDRGGVNMDVVVNKTKELYPNGEYVVDILKSKYINNKEKTIFLECSKCGNIFPISYVNLCKYRGCPTCNKILKQESINIKRIKRYLNENNIPFTCERSFSDCKNKRSLKFDISIEINGRTKLIEYDGEFHDYGYNNNKESLEKVRTNDFIKTEYCKLNNIPLLRLRYNTFKNFEEQLNNFLSE